MSDKKSLIQKRGRCKGCLTRLKTFTDSISDSTSREEITTRLESLEETWKEFCSIEDSLLLIDCQESEIEENEKRYYDLKSLLLRALRHQTDRVKVSQETSDLNSTMNNFLIQQQSLFQTLDRSQNHVSTARLPKLNIPTFSGDYKEWPSFKDLFEASINTNESLCGAVKFQYLKGLVIGNPAALIRHLPITDASYDEAWEKLKKRFDKPAHIATSFIKTFMEQFVINNISAKTLRNLCDTSDEVIRGLKALGNDAVGRDPWLIYIILAKVDTESRELWSQEIAEKSFPTFEEFLTFLNKRCDALETASISMKRAPTSVKALHTSLSTKCSTCPRCNADHPLYQCPEFKTDTVDARKSFVIAKMLCFKCLNASHSVRNCHSKLQCNRCKGKHHWLLHNSQSLPPSTTRPSNNNTSINHQDSINPDASINIVSLPQSTTSQIASLNTLAEKNKLCELVCSSPSVAALPTATCNIKNIDGQLKSCRILLDSGSQISLISESCVRRLGIKRENARLSVSGLSSIGLGVTRGKVILEAFPRWEGVKGVKIVAYVMENLTSYVPPRTSITEWSDQICNIPLADPDSDKSSSIDIIFGADKVFEVLREGKLYDKCGHQIAHETIFGWITAGALHSKEASAVNMTSTLLADLDRTLQSFWKADELGVEKVTLSEEETEAENHFKSTYYREANGRYVVSLPWRPKQDKLGNSKRNATIRLQSVERRFSKDINYRNAYITFMREYEELGHMELIPESEVHISEESCFYFPHHAVFKNEPNPKIRVVFDGSCKTSSGISLNDNLMVGPTLQRDLTSILLRFRKHKIALTADVQKMYRQVLVTPPVRNFQRILWREKSSLPIKHYRLKTVTYGTSSAPFLATRVLYQIGETKKAIWPEASSIIQNDFYVDDLLSGADSIASAIQLKEQLTNTLKEGCFPLTKWRSNSLKVLNTYEGSATESLPLNDNSGLSKVLGIQWNPVEDTFSFKISECGSNPNTKRKILSESSRLFDPLGWLAPVIVTIKIMFQQLWIEKYEWDENLPEKRIQQWKILKAGLPMIEKISIPRQIYLSDQNLQLHGFADASELAYAAVIYCRSKDQNEQHCVRLLTAKTRVSPLKQISLPRLELCAALLLTRLMKMVTESFSLVHFTVYAWTDSTIVLAWLSDIPRRWTSYVGNRTAEILECIPRQDWRHVSSHDNPADCASRGISPASLTNFSLWWKGPTWLSLDEHIWPLLVPPEDVNGVQREKRKKKILLHLQTVPNNTLNSISNDCSSYQRMVRIIAYCLRFISNTRKPVKERRFDLLVANEVNRSRVIFFKWIQKESFAKEIEKLKSNQPISVSSSLKKLNPFLDNEGILRVGGRLQNADCDFNARHPIILPKDHRMTVLLVRDIHRTYLHAGPSLLVSAIRRNYWIPGIRNIGRKIFRECAICFRQRATMTPQLMGSLPKARVTISRPFSQVGIDYAGPITLSTRTGRGSKSMKGYIALFVCFATKALHLELVSSLSSETFVAALRRFVSRRGVPKDIYSDNGTNFVGGRKYLNDLHQLAVACNSDELIAFFLSQHNITWHFIPPGAPHFGGLWEAAVRSVKWHLKRVVGETLLGFEEMTTLLTQIEAILNSRPICALSSDADDFNVLTPAHFLVGEALTNLPEENISDRKTSHLGRWQQIQAMMQGFWKRWRLDYLSSLQERQKWNTTEECVKVNDLVVLREDNLPPTRWLMGRILEVFPGKDDIVRVVLVKTQRGTIKRAINRVFKIPIG